MGLQSELLRDDPKLEAAAVSDPAHIVQGARGEHVRKIQLALIRLDGAAIDPDGVYGPATAAAVLAYKRRRDIVNRSYQTKADDIVGKMTMAALDREMLADELKPILIQAVIPPASSFATPRRGGLLFAFSVGDSTPRQQTPSSGAPIQQMILVPGQVGSIKVINGAGGQLIRTEHGGSPKLQVAKLLKAKVPNQTNEEVDIEKDPETFQYQALACGESFFQARVSGRAVNSKTAVLRLLSLVATASPRKPTNEDRSPDPNLKTGFVSKAGTPLKPLPGRKINVFGEAETPDFEDYSTDLDFCSHSFSGGTSKAGTPEGAIGHRPWTDDPRKPPGIPDKSVSNICCRGSPISQVTLDEILRIGASKGRVTYAEASGRRMCDRLRAGLEKKGARVIEEGPHDNDGRAIVFELA